MAAPLRRPPPPLEQAGDPAAQAAWLERDAASVVPEGALARQLGGDRPLIAKLGLDPTAPDIHLGHTVVLQKLRDFQDFGHEVVLIVGDYTARVGDPSGRSATRPILSREDIDAAAATYAEQAFRVLDRDRTTLRFNSEWLDMPIDEFMRLAESVTLARVLERDDFAKRMDERLPLSVLELFYPLIQGYDSVAIRADVEIGATDQTFNIVLGRDVQRHYGIAPQSCITMPILLGLDGETKMSKSLGNYIGVTEPAESIRAKTMELPDGAIANWYELLFDAVPDPAASPDEQRRELADALVTRFG